MNAISSHQPRPLTLLASPSAGTASAGTASATKASAAAPAPQAPVDGLDLGETARILQGPEARGLPTTQELFKGRGWVYDPTVGPDHTVYVGCGDDHVYAFNPDGTVKWRTETGLVLKAPTVAPDGTVYAGTNDGALYALNPDGTVKWRLRTPYGEVGPVTIGADGDLYFGSAANEIRAIHPDKSEKWTVRCQGGVTAPPLVPGDGHVYVGDHFGVLHAVEASSGREVWSRETHEPFEGPVALGQDGSVLMARWKTLEALDPSSGEVRWKTPASPGRQAGPVVEADGHILVACHDGSLRFYRPDGQEERRATVEGSLATTPRLGPDGMIVVRDVRRRVWAFDHDGKVIWSQGMPDASCGASILPTPGVSDDGTVYVGNNDCCLTAMHYRTLAERIENDRQEARPTVPRIEVGDEWIIVGGVKVPVRRG